jgi:translation initiation factor IF-2
LAIRVFELAKELGVTSKAVLDKCRAEEIDLKNHMAVLSAGLEATIREWFTEGAVSTAVETTEHVDLEKEHVKAKRQRRRHGGGEEELPEQAPAAEGVAVETAAPEAPAAPSVEAPAPAEVVEAPAPEAPPTAPVAPAAPAPAAPEPPSAPVAVEQPSAVAAPAAPAQPLPPTQAPPAPVPEVAAGQPPAAPAVPALAAQAPAATPAAPTVPPTTAPAAPTVPPAKSRLPFKPVRPTVTPAGPQLVPRPAKLSGPRVVRVEKPDFVQSPPPRRRPTLGGISRPSANPPPAAPATAPAPGGIKRPGKPIVVEEEDEAGKKAKKRSPRRRGGRSADSGVAAEGLKEWRDRDLAERSQRLAAATGGGLRRHRASVAGGGPGEPASRANEIELEAPISIKQLSAALGIKSASIIRKLMDQGTMVTVNHILDEELAKTLAKEQGIDLIIQRARTAEEVLAEKLQERPKGDLTSRAPVVTFLGHVDHGKTSLMDRIRKTTVAEGEAGGITQHIGAYRYDIGDKHVVFLDTPGHEAFTAMRARGANMTDVVVLVVAADDGVMPQTVEAISHAKAAKVPIVVALNKIDVPNANVQKALGQLAEQGLQPREWGGNVEIIRTSAQTGEGVDTLVETLSLEAEILELKAEPAAPASGYVIEAQMSPGLGVVARLLVRDGTLKVGQVLLAGQGYGKVRRMTDSRGQDIDQAGPSTPVEVSGLDAMPEAGDKFYVAEDLDEARNVAEDRRMRARDAALATVPKHTLEDILGRIEAGKADVISLIIKADVQGSIEAIVNSLNKLSTPEVRVDILHATVGGITTGDVQLAEASDAIIIGFNAVPDANARQLAERAGVDIRHYRIIYEIIDDIRKALEEGLAPEIRLQVLGHADIRQVFKVSRVGSVAGCYVTDGVVNRNSKVRITRNNIVVEDERTLESLKRFKDDAREVRAGMECGLKVAGYDDIKEGDVLEFYQKVEVARKL